MMAGEGPLTDKQTALPCPLSCLTHMVPSMQVSQSHADRQMAAITHTNTVCLD